MNYKEAVDFLNDDDGKIVLDLSKIKVLLQLLGNPQKKLKTIHVTGTNGKGSVCLMLSSILKESGYKCGMFTSPIIFDYKEQFLINGLPITEEKLIGHAATIKKAVAKMQTPPSSFEKAVVLAFLYFVEEGCHMSVFEVGMGGRDDATNVIENPLASVIAKIGLDHTKFLGNTLEEIATIKGGIIKNNCPVIMAEQESIAMETIRGICSKTNSSLTVTSLKDIKGLTESLEGQSFYYKNELYNLSLLGRHQQENAAIVLETVNVLKKQGLNIEKCHIDSAFKGLVWPGRFQVLSQKPLFILDGAHNPHGINALVQNLNAYLNGKKIIFLTGILKDKDYTKMLQAVLPYAKAFVTIAPPNDRALSALECKKTIENAGFKGQIYAAESIAAGKEKAIALSSEENPVVAFGSLYSVSAISKN